MSTTAERLWETARTLPEPLLAELLDFAEFLRAREARLYAPVHGLPLTALCGGLASSETFAGSAVSIQERLRNEPLSGS